MHNHHKNAIFVIIAGIIVAVLLFRFVGANDLMQILSIADKKLILGAILLQVPMFFFWNLKWKLVFNFVKQKISFWKLFLVLLIGNLGDTVSPGSRVGGEPLRIYYLEKLGYREDISLTTILLERVYNLIAFLAVAIFSFAYTFVKLSVPLWIAIIMLFAFAFVLSLAYLLLHAFYREKQGIHFIMRIATKILPYAYRMRHTRLHMKYRTYNKLYEHFHRVVKHFFDEVIVLSKNRVLWAEGTFLSFAYWFSYYVQAWIIFKAVGAPAPFYFLVVMLTLSDLVGFVLFIPSGAGVVEILMVVFATSFGIPVAGAVAATLLIRGIYYIFGLVSGYGSMLYFAEK